MLKKDSANLATLLGKNILIIDGAMGTMVQTYPLDEQDYRGARFIDHTCDLKGNNDLLTLTQPQIVKDIHAAYLQAGAHIIETNTFNATRISQADYQLEEIVFELEAPNWPSKRARKLTLKIPISRDLSPAFWGRQIALLASRPT